MAYEFRTATEADMQAVMSLTVLSMIGEEPMHKAIGLKPAECRRYFEFILGKCLATPWSIVAIEKSSKEVVGMRMVSVASRNGQGDYKPFNLDPSQFSPPVKQLYDINEVARIMLWKKLDSYIQKVAIQHYLYAKPGHEACLEELSRADLDPKQMMFENIQGYVGEAFNAALQAQQKAPRHLKIYEWEDGVQHADGSKTFMLTFRDFRRRECQ